MDMINDTNKNYLTVADVKRHLNISQAAAYELAHRSDFPVCRFGGSIRIPRDAFLAWVDYRTHIPQEIQPFMGRVSHV